jgi:hypothetical protein
LNSELEIKGRGENSELEIKGRGESEKLTIKKSLTLQQLDYLVVLKKTQKPQ